MYYRYQEHRRLHIVPGTDGFASLRRHFGVAIPGCLLVMLGDDAANLQCFDRI